MQEKLDFVILAGKEEANISLMSRRFGITRNTAYKWIKRYKQLGEAGLSDQSRRPRTSPFKTCPTIEAPILTLRKENPEWGAKKLEKVLEREGILPLDKIPSRPTITAILKRNGLISEEQSKRAEHWQRFEREHPNELWQMDFKSHFNLMDNTICYPLTILDDHSRYNIGLFASKNQRWFTVKDYLTKVFTTYGMPVAILTDNGSPWGSAGNMTEDGLRAFTKLEKWLILLGININHGRAFHPQTQGKDERFHRTLKAELLQHEPLKDFIHCQHKFDKWRQKYNHYRPHESINLQVPSQLYQSSKRTFPSVIKPPEYDLSDTIRKVAEGGFITFNRQRFRVGRAFIGETVAIRTTQEDGIYEVYFCNQRIRTLNLRT